MGSRGPCRQKAGLISRSIDPITDVLHPISACCGAFVMAARVCDNVGPEQARGFVAAEFASTASDAIAPRRAEWVAQFGPRLLAAKTAAFHEAFVAPRCVSVGG